MTDARPNSMRKLDNAIRKMAAGEKSYVNVRSLIANAIVGQMIPAGAVVAAFGCLLFAQEKNIAFD